MYKCKIAEIDIGTMIRRKVEEQHWSYTAFASAIGCSRSALYNIFNNRDISVIRLLKISEVLRHDFSPRYAAHYLPQAIRYPTVLWPYAFATDARQSATCRRK